jgi:uncharacterized protein YcaQ
VARLDPKLERDTITLQIKGFWYQADAPVKDMAFASALALGLIRFAEFLEAGKIDIAAIHPTRLRKETIAVIKKISDTIL